MSDRDLNALMKGVAAGDKAAFSELYTALERPLFRFIASKMNDPFEAGDIHQEVFVEIWRSAGRFEGRSTVKTWMFGIAYRKIMDRFRKNSRVELTDEPPEQEDLSPDALTRIAASEQSEALRFCLEELSAPQRLAIELAFFEDMTYREIAEIAETAEGTAKTRVFHAKKLLLHCLTKKLEARPS